MKTAVEFALSLIVLTFASDALGHGIPILLNQSGGTPTSLVADSDAPYRVYNVPTQVAPDNLFLGRFAATTTTDPVLFPGGGNSYLNTSGFAQTEGPWLAYTSATYNIISPLYFADGTGPAVPASSGSHLDMRNRFGGNSDGNHPGAATGGVSITGTSGNLAGPDVSMFDSHEMAYRLYLDPGSTQTYGAYAFAFTVTVNFSGGTTLTSGPLLDVLQMRDPSIAGGLNFNDAGNATLQSFATTALYNALVPEPSSVVLATTATAALGVCAYRAKRRHTACGRGEANATSRGAASRRRATSKLS